MSQVKPQSGANIIRLVWEGGLRAINIIDCYSSNYLPQSQLSVDRETVHVNMKTKISLQCPSLLVFYSFLRYKEKEVKWEAADGDEMFARGLRSKILKIH